MEFVNLIPSPHELLRTSLSLFNYILRPRSVESSPSTKYFDIDDETGFMPSKPLPRLPSMYDSWEKAFLDAQESLCLGDDDSEMAAEKHVAGEQWRSAIASWPVLSVAGLRQDLALMQRAHLVLAWLVHFYVHSIPTSRHNNVLVPKSLAVPLVEVSQLLGIAPVLTLADTVLWNFEPIDPSRPMSLDNIQVQNTFSGTESEINFYTYSAKAEIVGVELLRIIDEYNSIPNINDLTSTSKIARLLVQLKANILDLTDVIQSVRAMVDPHVFYWDMRPWFEGSDADGTNRSEWLYEGVPDSRRLDLCGPSGGQSTVMHALDVFLDIDHKLRQRRYPAPSEENRKADCGFMDRMRRYMPGKHRAYLDHLSKTLHPVRELAQKMPSLREPYDAAVMALKKLRDTHMRVACVYVVAMGRSTPDARSACPVAAMLQRSETSRSSAPARGTGGNEVISLLNAGRDATRRAMLKIN